MDPLVPSVVARYAANMRRLDLAWVEGLRKDFLTLGKNLPRVKDYKTAHELRDAFRIYRENFNDLFFEHFLNHDLKYELGLPEGDAKYYDKRLRSKAWDFSIELSPPIGFADEYYSEEAKFRQFEQEAPKWKARVQRKAQVFWKEMKEVIVEFAEWKKKTLDVKMPVIENTVIEGFKVEVQGYEPDDDHHPDWLAMFREGLKRYRQRAAAVAPILLRKQCPIVAHFNGKLDQGGEYKNGVVYFYLTSMSSKGVDWVVHALAHEMGHHLWKTYLSKEAQDFWQMTIRGDYGDLDLKELLDNWPGDAWAFEFPSKLKDTNPILALQVEAISYDRAYGELQKKEEFQKLYDQGDRKIRVPKHPITGYANKNQEEAFCETIGMLVAYGPRVVHEKVRMWLETALPGAVKVATLTERVAERFKTLSV